MSDPFVDQPEDVPAAFARLDSARPLALDTEFMRERTYFPQLALVRCADATGQVLLIDPLDPGMLDPLATLIAGIHALMHSASEDLVAFRHTLGILPRSLYDTQIAAAFAGLGAGIGYQSLVKTLLGIDLPKTETRSDWLRRPLSAQQRTYAADDVRHLHAVIEALDERLHRRGQRERALADMTRMLDNARDDRDDPQPHLGMRPAAQFERLAQARLRRLLRWRDATARRKNLPKRWLLDNDLALTLAQHPPTTVQLLDIALEAAHSARRLREEIAALLAAPMDADEATMPLATDTERTDRARLKAMQAVVAERALALDLPEGLLCARRHLERLLTSGEWPPALDGWRREVLEPPLRRMLMAKPFVDQAL